MNNNYQTMRLILGDQLNASHSWFKQSDPSVLYVIAELKQETDYTRHHVQKICAFFAAMQAFAQALQQAGHQVLHLTLDDTAPFPDLPALLRHLLKEYQFSRFEYQLPDEYRLRQQLDCYAQQSDIPSTAWETEHFYLSEQQLPQDFKAGKRHRMEAFYRKMRVRHQLLMVGDEPEGGEWNFDKFNRNKLTKAALETVPQPLAFANDVSDILQRLERHNVATIGQPQSQLLWPVTRQQARQLLEYFCQYGLPLFGEYQDAMTGHIEDRKWSLFHSRLSFALNSKLLSPQYVVDRVVEQYRAQPDNISLPQVEGFVRQILGWREFIRGIYWANMPDYGDLNHLQAQRTLPSWFWDGKTKMRCQQQAVSQSLEYAYAHHIQRLMITGNFCLIAGIQPDQVDQWYLGIYVDAIEWVEMPNTRGMSQFADGGIVGSKAYAASGNYVNKMSDYCSDCFYQVKQITGAKACPLNAMYWHFMQQHREAFASNPRNRMVYSGWDKKTPEQQQAILDQAENWLGNLDDL